MNAEYFDCEEDGLGGKLKRCNLVKPENRSSDHLEERMSELWQITDDFREHAGNQSAGDWILCRSANARCAWMNLNEAIAAANLNH